MPVAAALAAALLAACTAKPGRPLAAGECREQADCPATAVCLNEDEPGARATCGCRTDRHCPLRLHCDPLPNVCRCAEPSSCGPLSCDPRLHVCRCACDAQCAAAAPGLGCRCEDGQCVRPGGTT